MTIGSMFGTRLPALKQDDPYDVLGADDIAILRDKLREAEATIERLRDALGPNHPLGRLYRGGMLP